MQSEKGPAKQRFLACAIVVLCGCGGGGDRSSRTNVLPTRTNVLPTSPTPFIETWTATGIVSYTSFLLCPDCVVEVVDGPLVGTSTLTDSRGRFSLALPNETPQVTLRARKEGYRGLEEKVATRGSPYWVNLFVASVQPPAPVRGSYLMTLEADPIACTALPASARTREFPILVEGDTSLRDSLFRAEPVEAAVERFEMYVGVSGNDVGVSIWHPDDESAGIIERLNGDTGESFSLLAWTAVPVPYADGLTAPLKGTITWCPTRAGVNCVVCEASGHRLTLLARAKS